MRAVGERRIDEVAALRHHPDHAGRRLDDERRLVVLDEEVADEPALRGAGQQLVCIGDLAGERQLRATGRRQLRKVIGQSRFASASDEADPVTATRRSRIMAAS